MNVFLGTESLKVDTVKDTENGRRDFQIDFRNVLKSNKFIDKLNFVMKRIVPSNAAVLIEADRGDNRVGKKVFEFIKSNGGTVVKVNAKQLREYDEFKGRSIIIVADVIESGRCLTNVSQALRNKAVNCPITYIVGVEKTSELTQRKSLRNTLTQCSLPIKHEFVFIEQLVLPVSTGYNSWVDELNFWRRNERSFDATVSKRIKNRIKFLQTTSGPLVDNLFLSTVEGENLKVQEGFVFWPKDFPSAKVTQADVYYTVASVLQNLRAVSRLKSFWHYQTVLDPKNFERFNDGAIRASLLRASSYGELDYSQYKEQSYEMAQIILGMLRDSRSSSGMDVPEFLLAIATKKLRLRESDSVKVVDSAKKKGGILQGLSNCIAA